MKFIYVLEDDPRFQFEIHEGLKSIDPKLHVRFFLTLAEFHEWLKLAAQEGPLSLAKGGKDLFPAENSKPLDPASNHELRLVISKDEFLGTKNMQLIRRARDFFLRKKICTDTDPTALILTSFDNPSFDIKLAEDRIINNVIYKPFDRLILRQDFAYALTGHHPLKDNNIVASFKMNSIIEMLKEVPIVSVSEVGFKTINNAEIPKGAISKYYGQYFEAESKKSLFAICYSCQQISDKEFLCDFRYFGAENAQIASIRRALLTNKTHKEIELQNKNVNAARILIIDETGPAGMDLKVFLTERFSNSVVFFYDQFSKCYSDLTGKTSSQHQELPKNFDFVFAHYDVFNGEGKDKRWQMLCDHIKERNKGAAQFTDLPSLFLYSSRKIIGDEPRKLHTWVKEVFFLPFDKVYITKKLVSDFSNFNNRNPINLSTQQESTTIKVANPIQITQISEAGLIMKYYRTISIGAFREFVLWRPNEAETPEIIGTVNFHEESKGPEESFLNHFVFFGMRDFYLKHIRLWLRDAYIKQKENES